MDERLAKRLLVLALVTFAVMGAWLMLLYAGLVFCRDIFDKALLMIMTPLLAILSWSENRNKRRRLGLANNVISATKMSIAASLILFYVLVVYFLYDRLESWIVIAPILIVFTYVYWAGMKTRKEFAMKREI
jgi:hypothetical protein